jgi:hypothetical protein
MYIIIIILRIHYASINCVVTFYDYIYVEHLIFGC